MPRTIIVIPCYNEFGRLPVDRLEAFARDDDSVDFVLVDDGSTDRTGKLLEELEKRAPERFRTLRLESNRGKAEAVRRGMLEAFKREPGFAGYWDADLAAPLGELAAMREILQERPEVRIVLGARVQLLGRHIERSALRHYPGRVFATVASQVLGLPVYDTQCGAKLFRCSDEIRALFQAPFLVGWTFDVEILARLISGRPGGVVPPVEQVLYELPLRHWTDAGASKVRASDFFRALWELVRIHRRYRPRSHLGQNHLG